MMMPKEALLKLLIVTDCRAHTQAVLVHKRMVRENQSTSDRPDRELQPEDIERISLFSKLKCDVRMFAKA